MNKWSELLLGLILIIAPIFIAFYSQNWGAWNFWSAAGTFFKGGLFWFVMMIGVLFVLLGISDLKESTNSRPQTQNQHPQPSQAMNAQSTQIQPIHSSQTTQTRARKRK